LARGLDPRYSLLADVGECRRSDFFAFRVVRATGITSHLGLYNVVNIKGTNHIFGLESNPIGALRKAEGRSVESGGNRLP
jgi:hypothetical protein